jgi:hypothetical protein
MAIDIYRNIADTCNMLKAQFPIIKSRAKLLTLPLAEI